MAERFLRAAGFLSSAEEEEILAAAVFTFCAGILFLLWFAPDLARGLQSFFVTGW